RPSHHRWYSWEREVAPDEFPDVHGDGPVGFLASSLSGCERLATCAPGRVANALTGPDVQSSPTPKRIGESGLSAAGARWPQRPEASTLAAPAAGSRGSAGRAV